MAIHSERTAYQLRSYSDLVPKLPLPGQVNTKLVLRLPSLYILPIILVSTRQALCILRSTLMLHPYCSRTMADYKVDRKAFVEQKLAAVLTSH